MTGTRIMVARQMLGWEEIELARRAGIRIATVRRAESVVGEPPTTMAQSEKIKRALETGGIEFTADGVGVKLRNA